MVDRQSKAERERVMKSKHGYCVLVCRNEQWVVEECTCEDGYVCDDPGLICEIAHEGETITVGCIPE